MALLAGLALLVSLAPRAVPQEPNPHLAAPVGAITHFDCAQTDTFPFAVPRGTFRVDLSSLEPIAGGPVNMMVLASRDPERLWAVSGERVAYVDRSGDRWRALAEIDLPWLPRLGAERLRRLLDEPFGSVEEIEARAREVLGPRPQGYMMNGAYCLVDAEDVLYVKSGGSFSAFGLKDPRDPAAGLRLVRRYEARKVFLEGVPREQHGRVRLLGLSMTYDGFLILGATNGLLVIDRGFERPPVVWRIPADRAITNAASLDPEGGVYLATDSLEERGDGILHKLVWTGSRLSTDEADGAWTAPFSGGAQPPYGKVGFGTGSTPTLMGFAPDQDRLVVLTDGADRMKIVAFWRDAIPEGFAELPGTRSRRVAGVLPITAGLPLDTRWIQTNQSVVVKGWGAFVVNNATESAHPDLVIESMALGPFLEAPRGMERVEWDPEEHRWRSVWTRGDVSSPTMVPAASAGGNMALVGSWSREDGWGVTGLDWDSGETVHRTIFGTDNRGNGAYALVQALDTGELLFNSIGGPFRIPAGTPEEARDAPK